MASANVLTWILKNKQLVRGHILEVGSRETSWHSTLPLRQSFVPISQSYAGCDLEAGPGVDFVVDLTTPFEEVDAALLKQRFDTMFCISVLEHIPNVFDASRNLSALLAPQGALFVSVPFVFRFHGYPGDYWRFTPEAIEHLFPDLDFKLVTKGASITVDEPDGLHRLPELYEKRNRLLFRPKDPEYKRLRKEQKLAAASAGVADSVEVLPYSLAPAMINMIGVKPD